MTDTKENEALKEIRDTFKADFHKFILFFLKHLCTTAIPPFHVEIYNYLISSKRLVLASPRGFAKSTICSVMYPLWLAITKQSKDICIISASETLAIEWLRKIRSEIELNERIIAIYGDLRSEKWTENHLILSNGVNIRARGAGGQIRGFRPDCIILDDIETDEGVESEDIRKKLKTWLFKACLNTLTPFGQLVIIGTVMHPLSVLADLLAVDNAWTKKKYQAYKDGKQEAGYELWPELWPHDKLQQRKKEIGSFAFSSEFLNNPLSDETAVIKENQIRYWKEFPTVYSSVIAVDPAYSEDDSADYKTASHIAIDGQSNRYLATYIRTHAPIGEFQDSIINLWLQNKGTITAVGIPNSGVEKAFFDSFLKKCEERKVYPPIVELKNAFQQGGTTITHRNKKSRIIAALQPLFEQGKYYIFTEHLEARDELLTIGSSRWDDIVDTMAYAEQLLQPVYYDMMAKQEYGDEEKIDHGATGYE